jgi:hypothetical protein
VTRKSVLKRNWNPAAARRLSATAVLHSTMRGSVPAKDAQTDRDTVRPRDLLQRFSLRLPYYILKYNISRCSMTLWATISP